jgi:hypothetical protein
MTKKDKIKLQKAINHLQDNLNQDGYTDGMEILLDLLGKKVRPFEPLVSGEAGGRFRYDITQWWLMDVTKEIYDTMKKLYIEVTDIEKNKVAMDRPFIISVNALIDKYDSQLSR